MKGRLGYWAARVLLAVTRWIPLSQAQRVGGWLGLLAFWGDGRHRRVGLKNLEIAFGKDWFGGRAHRRLLLQCYRHLATSVLEGAHFVDLDAESIRRLVRYEGTEHFLAAEREGKGILLLTAHVGNFELMALAHSLLAGPIHFIARPLDNERVDRYLGSLRSLHGNRIIDKKKAARQVLVALKNGEMVGILADQNATRSEGVFVDFFGCPASAFLGPARLAMRAGAAVFPVFIVRDGLDGTHTIHVCPRVDVARSGDRKADVRETTQRFQKAIEDFVRRYPEQWFWVHRRWKTRPTGEPRFY
jgi:Kdo2-lipid IVA lauroyltransferase/acyltransferase